MSNNIRYVGLDVHKSYVMAAAVNADQQVVLKPRRIDLVRFEAWAAKHLRATDQVVLESTTNAWTLHDLLEPIVARVVVAHPYHIKLIAAAAVKTDKRDTLALARLLSAHMIPEVWVPPQHVRDLRALIAHRQRLVSQRTAAKNRLQSVLHRHQLVPPQGALFAKKNNDWWASLPLPASERLRITQDQAIIAYLNPMIDEVEAALKKLSISDLWADQVLFLLQLPGIGLVKAMTILGAIGEIERFPSAKKLVGYAGLGSRVHSSGQTHHTGAITKQGRRELRHALVEAAWTAVKVHAHWKDEFNRLKLRIGKKKAIVAIARKLLVTIWHVLSKRQADIHADPELLARKFSIWAWQLSDLRPHQLSPGQFIRFQLARLDLGHDLDHFFLGKVKRLIPSLEDVAHLLPAR